jgi:hypothetical protein
MGGRTLIVIHGLNFLKMRWFRLYDSAPSGGYSHAIGCMSRTIPGARSAVS